MAHYARVTATICYKGGREVIVYDKCVDDRIALLHSYVEAHKTLARHPDNSEHLAINTHYAPNAIGPSVNGAGIDTEHLIPTQWDGMQ